MVDASFCWLCFCFFVKEKHAGTSKSKVPSKDNILRLNKPSRPAQHCNEDVGKKLGGM